MAVWSLSVATWILPCVAFGDESRDAKAFFAGKVQPILRRACYECHEADSPESGLDLTSTEGVFTGSESGAVVSPGKSTESLLVQVLSADAELHMPPEAQLSADEIAVITRWIDELDPNVKVGSRLIRDEDRNHWSFQPVERPIIPDVQGEQWTRTPIDHFVLARLEESGLNPSGQADKSTLLRRVYFDLVGLPPSPDDIAAFVNNDRPDAFEQTVDRLLASPQYGERWGRHWLDLARYADSSGFHDDVDRPHAWRYRDYVIESFNNDKSYARFVREQLAGDELPDASPETWIATGFCRNGPTNDNNMGKGVALEKYRMDELDDIVSTTSNVFLGLTIGCARCHNHKFDPLSQHDYYRFLAYFHSTERRRLNLSSMAAKLPELLPVKSDKKNAMLPAAMVRTDLGLKSKSTYVLWRGDVRNRGPIVLPGIPDVLDSRVQSSKNEPEQQKSHRSNLADWITDSKNPLTWRVMANRVWHYHFGRGLVNTPSNFGRLGERPTHPKLLDWLADALRRSGGSLKSLHREIVTSAVYRQASEGRRVGNPSYEIDPENRLLWRMNRRRLEAEPLRDAMLAVAGNLNVQMGGPGVKPRIRPELLVASQRNKWPEVKTEGPQHWRRSVYIYVKRQLQFPMLELFGAPSTAHSCARREDSLVPTQSLVMMNDDFMHDQASRFASRIVRETDGEMNSCVKRAFLIAVGREPSSMQVDEAIDFLESQSQRLIKEGCKEEAVTHGALTDFCHVLMNLSEFVYVE